MSSDLERYISDNSLRVSDSYLPMVWGIAQTRYPQLFGLADRSIIDYVLASGASFAHLKFSRWSDLSHASIVFKNS